MDGPFGSMDYTARDASPACPKTQSLNSWTTGLRLEDGVVTSRYRAGAVTHRSKRGTRIPCSSSCAIIEVRLMATPMPATAAVTQSSSAAFLKLPLRAADSQFYPRGDWPCTGRKIRCRGDVHCRTGGRYVAAHATG